MSDLARSTGVQTEPQPGEQQEYEHPVYLYGIIPAADAEHWQPVPGLDGPSRAVRTVVEGGLAALVSDLAPDHVPGRPEDLEAHSRVLEHAIERGATLPMRFGHVVDGDDRVRREVLAGHAAELGSLMAALQDDVQMTVKAYYAKEALLRDVLAAHPDLARESAALASMPEADPARVALGERIAAAAEARRAEVESALMAALSGVPEDVVVEPPSSDRVALSAQLLVRRDRRPALDAQIGELSAALQDELAFRYVGPLPPYSFSTVQLHGEHV
jgi:Gas vesicle synthesis protein GvpL/GvpF